MLIYPRKFQKNAFTQYALEQLSNAEKELILQSESLEAFMTSVTPRYHNTRVDTICWLLASVLTHTTA